MDNQVIVYKACKNKLTIEEKILVEDRGEFLTLKDNRISKPYSRRKETVLLKYCKTNDEAKDFLLTFINQTLYDLATKMNRYEVAKNSLN